MEIVQCKEAPQEEASSSSCFLGVKDIVPVSWQKLDFVNDKSRL